MPAARENVSLIGFMGSGKSSIGRTLAGLLDWRFVDTDRLVVEADGRSISEIFAAEGEAIFREKERAALASVREQQRQVIATGGGIVTRGENVTLLRAISFVVWLTADEGTLFERVSRNKRRPLLQTMNPRETMARLLAEREPLYQGAAHFVVDTASRSHAEIAELIAAELACRE